MSDDCKKECNDTLFEKTVLSYSSCQYIFDYGKRRSDVLSSKCVIIFKSSDESKIDSRIKNGYHPRNRYMDGDYIVIHSKYEPIPEGYDWKEERKKWAKDLSVITDAYYSIGKIEEPLKVRLSEIISKISDCKEELDYREEELIRIFKLGIYRIPSVVNLDEE